MPVSSDDIQLTAPAPGPVMGVSAQITGPSGLATYYYWWVATYPVGVTVVSAPVGVRSAPSPLTATNFVTITGQRALGATKYDLLRTNGPQLPSGTANIAVATALTSPTFNDQGASLTAYNVAGLAAGAPVSAFINLNNRDYAQPTIVMSPFGTAVQSLVFPDGSTQTSAGASPYNWTQNVQSNGFQLLGLTGLVISNPAICTFEIVSSGAPLGDFTFSAIGNQLFISDQTAASGSKARIVIGPGAKVAITTGTFTPTHLLQLNVDDAFKPTTNTWGITSDIRTKRNSHPLEGGLSVIMELEPIESEYNGRADTPEGGRVVSFDPERLAKVLPDAVSTVRGKLHPSDEEETDIAGVNTHEVLHHLVLAVQQLSEEIKALQRRRIPSKGIS